MANPSPEASKRSHACKPIKGMDLGYLLRLLDHLKVEALQAGQYPCGVPGRLYEASTWDNRRRLFPEFAPFKCIAYQLLTRQIPALERAIAALHPDHAQELHRYPVVEPAGAPPAGGVTAPPTKPTLVFDAWCYRCACPADQHSAFEDGHGVAASGSVPCCGFCGETDRFVPRDECKHCACCGEAIDPCQPALVCPDCRTAVGR